jgi:hypothetical protein
MVPFLYLEIVTFVCLVLQEEMITEMVVVVAMGIQVGCLGRMVGVVEAHIMAAEEIVPARRDRIRVMMVVNGIQLARTGKMVGGIFQVLKFKILLAGRLSQVVGVVVVVVEVAVTTVGGAMEVVVLTEEIGVLLVEMMLLLIIGVPVGEVPPPPPPKGLNKTRRGMDGLEAVVEVGEPRKALINFLSKLVSNGCFEMAAALPVLFWTSRSLPGSDGIDCNHPHACI